jgi:hypothetical protein
VSSISPSRSGLSDLGITMPISGKPEIGREKEEGVGTRDKPEHDEEWCIWLSKQSSPKKKVTAPRTPSCSDLIRAPTSFCLFQKPHHPQHRLLTAMTDDVRGFCGERAVVFGSGEDKGASGWRYSGPAGRFRWKAVLIVLAGCYLGLQHLAGTQTHHFRLSLSVETPDGVRTASSVLKVTYRWVQTLGSGPATGYDLKGEAVFLDLGQGRNIIMLLAHGPTGDSVDAIAWLPTSALLGLPSGWSAFEALANGGKKLAGSTELKPPLIPTIITFSDLKDPATARVITPEDYGYLFGAGTRFKGVKLEMVPVGIWPLNLIGITGTPVTRGIEGKMAFLTTQPEPLRRVIHDMPPRFQTGFSQFIRE